MTLGKASLALRLALYIPFLKKSTSLTEVGFFLLLVALIFAQKRNLT